MTLVRGDFALALGKSTVTLVKVMEDLSPVSSRVKTSHGGRAWNKVLPLSDFENTYFKDLSLRHKKALVIYQLSGGLIYRLTSNSEVPLSETCFFGNFKHKVCTHGFDISLLEQSRDKEIRNLEAELGKINTRRLADTRREQEIASRLHVLKD